MGHSEVDDPTVTQPRRYAKIKEHPALYKLYAERLGVDPAAETAAIQNAFFEEQKAATKAEHKPKMHELPDYWKPYYGGPLREDDNPRTGLDAGEIAVLTAALTKAPQDFHIHPKVAKLLEQRVEMGNGRKPIDYGMAELLAYAIAAEGWHPGAVDRAGLAARHFQSAPLRLRRHRDRSTLFPVERHLASAGTLAGLQLHAFRGRVPGIRVRFLARLP